MPYMDMAPLMEWMNPMTIGVFSADCDGTDKPRVDPIKTTTTIDAMNPLLI
jgi:hypothetical protein